MIIYRLIIIFIIIISFSCKKDDSEDIEHPIPKINQELFSDKYENDIYNYDSVDSLSQDYE